MALTLKDRLQDVGDFAQQAITPRNVGLLFSALGSATSPQALAGLQQRQLAEDKSSRQSQAKAAETQLGEITSGIGDLDGIIQNTPPNDPKLQPILQMRKAAVNRYQQLTGRPYQGHQTPEVLAGVGIEAPKDFTLAPEATRFSGSTKAPIATGKARTPDVTKVTTNIAAPAPPQGESALIKEYTKGKATELLAGEKVARSSSKSLGTIKTGRQLLDKGIISGFGRDFRVTFGKALNLAFGWKGDVIANTEAFYATMARETLEILGSGALGGGTAISDADRDYAAAIVGGSKELTEDSMREILRINEIAHRVRVREHNKTAKATDKWLKERGENLPPSTIVPLPNNFEGMPADKTTAAKVNKLKSGTMYTDPNGTERVRK